MWKAVAVALPLTLLCVHDVRAGGLSVSNVRSTYGFLGAPRPDNKYLPGDAILLLFDINNLKADPNNGLCRWTVVLEVYDDKKPGKPIFSKSEKNDALPCLGGSKVPGFAKLEINTDFQASGKYTFQITLKDLQPKGGETVVKYPFEVQAARFGLVRLSAPSIACPLPSVPGNQLPVECAVVGMKRDDKKQFKVQVKLSIFDSAGKMTLPKAMISDLHKDLPEEARTYSVLPFVFPIEINRAGRFRVEIEATDLSAKKTDKLSYTLTVFDPANVPAGK